MKDEDAGAAQRTKESAEAGVRETRARLAGATRRPRAEAGSGR